MHRSLSDLPIIGPLVRAQRRLRAHRIDARFRGLSPEATFTRIYRDGRWGADDPFHPGWGSRDHRVVDEYVTAVRGFLSDLDHKPDTVDLGCGDFTVGALLRPFCSEFIACDVVAAVIEANRRAYRHLGVDFRHLDLTRDLLPAGEVAIVRQVLQHLTNRQIAAFLDLVPAAGYRFLVITEEIPGQSRFVPNRDKPIGPGIRIGRAVPDSGVVLTAPPFDLTVGHERVLSEAKGEFGVIRTTLYELA